MTVSAPDVGAGTWSFTHSGERVHIYPRCPAIAFGILLLSLDLDPDGGVDS